MTIQQTSSQKLTILYFAAASAVAVAGMIHLMLTPGNLRFNVNEGILFGIGGIAQVFWLIPIVRRWGNIWYLIGIGGNITFFAIWLITRFPGNPITGRGELRVNSTELITEVAQFAFIGLTAAIILLTNKNQKMQSRQNFVSCHLLQRKSERRYLMILGGVVAALVLVSVFALPMLIPKRGNGGVGGRGIEGIQGSHLPTSPQLEGRDSRVQTEPTAAEEVVEYNTRDMRYESHMFLASVVVGEQV